jgi:glycosyltransferase involved in cell wall biosynthesis
MQKILYIITKSNFGGAQRYVYDLATHLPKDQFTVAVACGGTGERGAPQGELVSKLATSHICTWYIRTFERNVSFLDDGRALRELVILFRREKPDIVHLNSSKAILLGACAARLAGIPRIVATIHGWPSNETRPWWQRTFLTLLEHIGMWLCHATIVVCDHDIRAGTTRIYNGIETPHLLSRSVAREALGLPVESVIIGTIGELTANKNTGGLISAYTSLSPGAHALAIIGDGELKKDLDTLARAYTTHDIRLLGYKKHAAQYLRAFDVFVLPSHKEGLPYVLLEAGHAGIPIVGSKVGGIPEIISHTEHGCLCTSTPELTLALQKILADGTQRSSTNSICEFQQTFSLARMLEETIEMYPQRPTTTRPAK